MLNSDARDGIMAIALLHFLEVCAFLCPGCDIIMYIHTYIHVQMFTYVLYSYCMMSSQMTSMNVDQFTSWIFAILLKHFAAFTISQLLDPNLKI